jgi:hypothetical protein
MNARESSKNGGAVAFLAAASAGKKLAHLAAVAIAAAVGSPLAVDAAAGIIRHAAVMTVGQNEGHPFANDATTLQQLCDLINAAPDGLKVRWKHPEQVQGPEGEVGLKDALGTQCGVIKNAELIGDTLRADVHFGEYAKALPKYGDVWTYALGLANERPQDLGLSAAIVWEPEQLPDGTIVARVSECDAVDLVGKPAANPNGLLGAKSQLNQGTPPQAPTQEPDPLAPISQGTGTPFKPSTVPGASPRIVAKSPLSQGGPMDPKLKELLVNSYGLDPQATDEQALAHFNALKAHLGMAADAPDEKVAKLAAKLSDDEKSEAKTAVMSALEADDDDKAALGEGGQPAAATLSAKPGRKAAVATIDPDQQTVALLGSKKKSFTQLAAMFPAFKDHAEAFITSQLAEGVTDINIFRANLLKKVAEMNKPVQNAISVGDDQKRTSLLSAVTDAIRLRAGTKPSESFKPHELAPKFAQMSLLNIGRAYYDQLGISEVRDFSLSPMKLVDMLLSERKGVRYAQLAQSSSDFGSLLLDAMNKTLRQAYLDAPVKWERFSRRATAPDFKNINRVAISEAPSLELRQGSGELQYVTLSDSKETYALSEYANGIRLSRRAIINDDLDAFGRIPMLQGAAARRLEDEVTFAVITANATMADTGALFNSTAVTTAGGHANLASSGGAIGIDTLQAGENAIFVQRGPKNAAILELEAKFLLVPSSLRATAEQLIQSKELLNVVAAANGSGNPFYNRFEVIPSARLNANSATAWYLLADYRTGQIDTIETCFLADEPEPVAKQETDWDTDDVKFAIRHVVASKAIDFRGFYKNPGP